MFLLGCKHGRNPILLTTAHLVTAMRTVTEVAPALGLYMYTQDSVDEEATGWLSWGYN
jgi:hypothetical protein